MQRAGGLPPGIRIHVVGGPGGMGMSMGGMGGMGGGGGFRGMPSASFPPLYDVADRCSDRGLQHEQGPLLGPGRGMGSSSTACVWHAA